MTDTKPKTQTIEQAIADATVTQVKDFYDDDRDVYRVEMLDHNLSIEFEASSPKQARELAAKELATRPSNLMPPTIKRAEPN